MPKTDLVHFPSLYLIPKTFLFCSNKIFKNTPSHPPLSLSPSLSLSLSLYDTDLSFHFLLLFSLLILAAISSYCSFLVLLCNKYYPMCLETKDSKKILLQYYKAKPKHTFVLALVFDSWTHTQITQIHLCLSTIFMLLLSYLMPLFLFCFMLSYIIFSSSISRQS